MIFSTFWKMPGVKEEELLNKKETYFVDIRQALEFLEKLVKLNYSMKISTKNSKFL